jgi:hypothetical protein
MTFYASTGTSVQTSPVPAARGRMGTALFAGLGAAVAGSIIWAIVAYLTKHQYSLVAILVGGMVGFTVGRIRPGNAAAAAAGALMALVGCALGTFLALISVAVGDGAHLGTVLGNLSVITHAYPRSVGGMGVVFWLLAAAIAFANTVGLHHDRQRPEPPGRPVAASAGARGDASKVRPVPGGYGTPQAPSEHDNERADDPAPVEWQLEPVSVQGSAAWPAGPETVGQGQPPALSAPAAPSAPPPAPASYGVPPSAPSPAFRNGGPLPAPLPAFRDAGPPSAPMPAFRDAGPPSAPIPAFRDAGPPSAPMPAVPRSGPPSELFPDMANPGHLSAPMPAFRDGGPPSAPLPAVPPRPIARPSLPARARHAAPPDAGQPSPGRPAPGRSADGLTAPTLPRRQRSRGRHSRPQDEETG